MSQRLAGKTAFLTAAAQGIGRATALAFAVWAIVRAFLWWRDMRGGRAALAASILDAQGFDVRLVDRGGAVGWPERFAALASR